VRDRVYRPHPEYINRVTEPLLRGRSRGRVGSISDWDGHVSVPSDSESDSDSESESADSESAVRISAVSSFFDSWCGQKTEGFYCPTLRAHRASSTAPVVFFADRFVEVF
jgi:hypothetical protein